MNNSSIVDLATVGFWKAEKANPRSVQTEVSNGEKLPSIRWWSNISRGKTVVVVKLLNHSTVVVAFIERLFYKDEERGPGDWSHKKMKR
ncbi:hypothetical protein E3N88_22986 [Mikania micrantha]|uniref:Uncharacterized protein n=1 Tax=Mikania micrantha TaxID=192012 RepID=A0A5N6NEN6_9ASTR|nr:hypothetical protein E3N88_22986 [Mikania micrantha]